MKREPAIDLDALVGTVRVAYGLDVRDLRFVPVGYAAACYVADCGPDGRRFVKVWPDTVAGREAGARQRWVLPLLRALQDRAVFPWVAAPVRTLDGGLSATVGGLRVAVFPLVEGATPPGWPRWRRGRWEALGRTMAAIHAATTSVADVLPPRGSMDAPFAADLRALLDAACGDGPGARPVVRAVLAPLRADAIDQLDRLEVARRLCAAAVPPMVLCHTDLGGDNVLFDGSGGLWALDWDDTAVAPPEVDLRVGVEGAHLAAFLGAYGPAPLSRDRFEFFLLLRSLGDAHARLVRLMREDVGPREEAELIDGILRWGAGEWRVLDRRLDALDRAIHR